MSLNGLRFGGNHRSPKRPNDDLAIAFWGCLVPGFFIIALFYILWSLAS